MKLKNVNNIKYRNEKVVLKYIDKVQTFKSPTLLSPQSLFHKPVVIAKYSTASHSIVYKLSMRKSNRSLVLKISPNLHSSFHENEIYKIINNLVKYKVTPFVLKSYNLKNQIIYRNNVHKSIQSDLKFKQGVVMCTETYGKNMKLLSKVQLKNPLICMFQTLYTLECFNRIGLSQSDLHHSNIFVVQLKGLKNYYNKFVYTSRSGVKREFFLPTSGEQIRIFDFDRALANQKSNVKSRFKIKNSSNQTLILSTYFGKFYQYFDEKRDLQRFLFPFFYKSGEAINIALKLFNLNNTKSWRYKYPSSITKQCSTKYMQYDYFVNKTDHIPLKIPDKYLPSVDQMLMSYVFDDLTILPIDGKIYTTYKIMS